MSPKHVIYKKLSRDKSVGVYMGRRDFVDHCDFVDPVDGVVLLDPELTKGKKVYVMLSCTFRYGRDDLDMLGMAFRRDIFLCTRQVYPPLQDRDRSIHTKIQERLLRKLGNNAYPFFFEFPDNLPCSVALNPPPLSLSFSISLSLSRSTVRLAIRKVQYAPEKGGPVPSNETTCEFMMSDKPLHMSVSLDKETYYHGEPINVSVNIDNSSSKDMKNITVSVEQVTNVVLYSNDKYVKSVAIEETSDSVPSGTSLKKVYTLCPLLDSNRESRGLALDGKLKHEDTNLASSTIVKDEVMIGSRYVWIFFVHSDMKFEPLCSCVTRVCVCVCVSEVAVEVPFLLMHPEPSAGGLLFRLSGGNYESADEFYILDCVLRGKLTGMSVFPFPSSGIPQLKRGKQLCFTLSSVKQFFFSETFLI
uniref:S-arrestin n=1 Tax=Pygocentrus nattereri TaxID=42514 RepID=A0AAR2L2L9_PYGNA